MITNHTSWNEYFSWFESDDGLVGGVELWRLGDLARAHGATRWKRSPAGTGANTDIVRLSLNANGLVLYSHDAVALTFSNGNLMTDAVLKELHADDHVVVLNRDFDTARAIADGTIDLVAPDYSDKLIEAYRGDRIRAANHNDVNRIIENFFLPALSSRKRS